MVGRLDGSEIVKKSITGSKDDAVVLGEKLGVDLLESGAGTILNEVMNTEGQ